MFVIPFILFYCRYRSVTLNSQKKKIFRADIYETIPPEVGCITGWSGWQNLHLPDRKGERESLEDIAQEELISCALDQVTQVQCREVKTSKVVKHSGENNIYCDLKHGGLKCSNRNMPTGQTCEDYEIRAYCDCEMVRKEIAIVTLAPPRKFIYYIFIYVCK